ncbi:unnamed protein product [Symbiodinium sp. CCMP2592]|nr:unnamed protein product [Symbiodinium sp. CCMP2592]
MAAMASMSLLLLLPCMRTLRSDVYTRTDKMLLASSLSQYECSPQVVASSSAETGEGHLIAMVTGYRGSVRGLQGLAEGLCTASFAQKEHTLIIVLDAVVGAHSVQPIMLQGERVAEEVLQIVSSGAKYKRNFTSYSIIGHSLGGLVARVAASHIDRSLASALRPRLFVSLFSPHAGVESFVNSKLLPTLIHISGSDRGAMDELCEKSPEKSILVEISRGVYRQALEKFEKRVLYTSETDWLVDFGSGGITLQKPQEHDDASISDYPSLVLESLNLSSGAESETCQAGSVRCEVINELRHLPFERVRVQWQLFRPDKHSLQEMSTVENSELLRHLTGEFGGSNSNLPRGARCVSSEFCAQGLECTPSPPSPSASSRSRSCQPRFLEASDACLEEDSEMQKCAFAVDLFNEGLQTWLLIVTSSGGGGHLVAARNLQKMLLERVEGGYETVAAQLREQRPLLTPEAYRLATAALSAVQRGPPAVEMLDIMDSPCTSLDGLGYISLGGFMSESWNKLQSSGDISGLRRLVSLQPWTQRLFGRQCRKFIQSVVEAKKLGYLVPPKRIISTQPLLVRSLLEGSMGRGVDLYMTDLPTEEAVHFFGALDSMPKDDVSDQLFLHTLAPMHGGKEALQNMSGVRHIMLEKFMPIEDSFIQPGGLPSPGQAVAIRLKAQIPLEEEFLETGPVTNPVVLEADDEVVLVMLGSQPTVDAMLKYAVESLKLPDKADPNKGKRYVFLACGRPGTAAYKQLYADMLALVKSSPGSGPANRTILVPFTGQRAAELLGRADVTITRSGGLTAGELLALQHRGDKKRFLLHVEPVGDEAKTRALAALPATVSDADAFRLAATHANLLGMVPWEAGNARYLQQVVSAKLVEPESLVGTLLGREQSSFAVDWRLFLQLRGFNAAAIDLAEARHCSYSPNRSRVVSEPRLGSPACNADLEAFARVGSAFTMSRKFLPSAAIPCNDTTLVVQRFFMPIALYLYNHTIGLALQAVASCHGTLLQQDDLVAVQL